MSRQQKMTAAQVAESICKHRHGDEFTITEVKTGSTWFNKELRKIDLVAIKRSWAHPCVTAYEIKVSRQDFLSDHKWPAYLQCCNIFSFACPAGVITKQDIEAIGQPGIGLVTINGDGKPHTAVKPLYRNIQLPDDFYLYIIMNRIDSDRIPFYSTRREYFEGWLANKERCRWIGREVSSKVWTKLSELEKELDDANWKLNHRDNENSDMIDVCKSAGYENHYELSSAFRRIEQINRIFGNDLDVHKILDVIEKIQNLKPSIPEAQ
jgi:hypothetical protein